MSFKYAAQLSAVVAPKELRDVVSAVNDFVPPGTPLLEVARSNIGTLTLSSEKELDAAALEEIRARAEQLTRETFDKIDPALDARVGPYVSVP